MRQGRKRERERDRVPIERYRAFLVDLDGVLVRGSEPIPGAVTALERLRRVGSAVIFSNNATRSRRTFARRLIELGFGVEPEMIVNSAYVVAQYLRKRAGPSSVFMIGEAGLHEELEGAGHQIVGPEDARFLVTGMDRGLTYEKLAQALRALRGGARYIATNADPTFPTPQGPVPGAGAVVGAMRGMGYPPEEIVGKPSHIAFEVALEAAEGCEADECLLIGDRLETDVQGALNSGIDAVLVLTGVTSPEELEESEIRPTWVVEDIAALAGV